jgi:outer membrane protein OmpA-like peptidoglycan-associated protein
MIELNVNQCTGVDKCPAEYGPVENEGCPLDNPDSDQDGVCDPWVTQKGMLDMFAGQCSGLDKCPYEAGSPDADGCLVEDIKLEVYFASGKAKLTANSKRTLRELAKNLNAKERKTERYQILGYTDDRGNDQSNLKLSQKRADAVVTELVKNGVDKSRLEAVGMGEADPIADNSTAEGRELNRRIMMKRIQ